ncbi:MAG: MFS transporter [Xanthobacteraceae bacterium]
MTAIHADLSEPADHIGSFPKKALAASAIGYAMDGFDLLILGFMLRAISADLHLTPPQAGSLITWTLIGAVVGGIGFGILSDYYGRVRVLTWTILLFAVFTGLGAFAQGYWDLLIYRTIAGLGLGGEFGIGMALVAEAWPAKYRARGCTYVALGWQAGVLAAALITPLLLPVIGWRGMFLVGLVPGLIAFAVRRTVEEPDIFLQHAKTQRASMPLSLLVKDAATTKISLGMLILCAVQNFGYYGLMIWLPSYLSTRFGYTLTQSALWTAVTVLGMACGIWIFGQFADRIGRRPALFTFQAGAFIMVLTYSQLTGPTALLIGGAIMGIFVNGMLGGYGALLAELYPTKARATAQNVLFNLGRGVGGFGRFVVGSLAAAYSFTAAIALLATIYLLDIVATAFLIPEKKGVPLG